MAPAGASFGAPAASWNAFFLLSALFWRLLCNFHLSWPALGLIFCHFGRPRPLKKHEFPREGRQNQAFRCIRVGCCVGPLLGVAWPLLGASWATSCVSLGASWGPPGASWGHLGGFLGASLRFPGALLGLLGGILGLGASYGPTGGPPGASGRPPGGLLGVSGGLPGPLGCFLRTSCLLAS